MGGPTATRLPLLLLLLWGQRSSAAACPTDSYLGEGEKCFPCKICEGEQDYEKKCSETANAVCKCIRCEGCGIGKQWTEKGCQSCPQGTFNDQIKGECRQWTRCLPNEIMIPGTETEDAICNPKFKNPAPSPTAPGPDTTEDPGIPATVALAVASALSTGLLLLFCVFFSLRARKKFPAYVFMKWPLKPPVQEVEDCSCRYPEEEEGGGDDTSGLKGQLLENIP